MTMVADIEELSETAVKTRDAFLYWQCRIRQIAMREDQGKPSDGMTPEIVIPGESGPFDRIITVLCKTREASLTPEFRHLYRKTPDPAQRRESAQKLLSSSYYQRPQDFSDILTATFSPASPGAARLRAARHVRLEFAQFNQRFSIPCQVWRLSDRNPLWQETFWRNILFNPALPANTVILGFEPDWGGATGG